MVDVTFKYDISSIRNFHTCLYNSSSPKGFIMWVVIVTRYMNGWMGTYYQGVVTVYLAPTVSRQRRSTSTGEIPSTFLPNWLVTLRSTTLHSLSFVRLKLLDTMLKVYGLVMCLRVANINRIMFCYLLYLRANSWLFYWSWGCWCRFHHTSSCVMNNEIIYNCTFHL